MAWKILSPFLNNQFEQYKQYFETQTNNISQFEEFQDLANLISCVETDICIPAVNH